MRLNCNPFTDGRPRCRVPLIEICPATSQIRLDLSLCDPCSPSTLALLIRKGGCAERVLVCEQPELVPCGCCPQLPPRPRWVEVPRPFVIYPLHEVDCNGLAVFVLDEAMETLGAGRLEAVVLLAVDDTSPAARYEADGVWYGETDVRLDVDYRPYALTLAGADTLNYAAERGC